MTLVDPISSRFTATAANTGAATGFTQPMPDDMLMATFLRCRDEFRRFLLLRGARAEEAQDVLQDVSLRLVSGTERVVEEPRAYLYAMVNNQFLLHRRGALRRERREQDWTGLQTGDPPELDETPSPEARLAAQDHIRLVQRALDTLPERTRTIFRRFRIEGEGQRTIADDLGISRSAVEKHLARAYRTLTAARRLLDDDRLPATAAAPVRGATS